MISTVIVEDDLYVQEVLQKMIREDDRFRLVAVYRDAFESEEICAREKIDLVLMDVQTLGNHSGLAAGSRIKQHSPKTKVVVLTSLIDAEVLAEAKKGAADSLWYKDYGTKEIMDVIDRTLGGERVFPSAAPTVPLRDVLSADLTEKQMKILRCFVKGYTYEEIGEELGMTKRNVRWHLDNVVEKCGFENKHELLIAILDSKLIVTNLIDD